ncbi:cyclase, partial [Mycobacterium gastri 'Wayne']
MLAHYALGLAVAYLLAVVDASAILIPLRGHTYVDFAEKNMALVSVLVVLGTVGVAVGGVLLLAPTLRWFVPGDEPTPQQREAAIKLGGRQSAILVGAWSASGSVLMLMNHADGAKILLPILLGVLLGGPAAAGTGLLLAQRTLRPIIGVATRGAQPRLAVPGVLARLVLLWFLCSAIPIGVIAAFVGLRSYGWLIQESASLDVPILVVSLAALLLGLPTMILTSRSISDPLDEIVAAMAQVEHGNIATYVGAYERSQIGRLQTGFNRMVAGLEERERLRDLFGRYVGTDVARRAIEEGSSLSGDVVEAAVLYIDLVGSTQLAENRPPQEVAHVLNDFFRIVVDAVDEYQGLVNKF